jgi:hypothetical protein
MSAILAGLVVLVLLFPAAAEDPPDPDIEMFTREGCPFWCGEDTHSFAPRVAVHRRGNGQVLPGLVRSPGAAAQDPESQVTVGDKLSHRNALGEAEGLPVRRLRWDVRFLGVASDVPGQASGVLLRAGSRRPPAVCKARRAAARADSGRPARR